MPRDWTDQEWLGQLAERDTPPVWPEPQVPERSVMGSLAENPVVRGLASIGRASTDYFGMPLAKTLGSMAQDIGTKGQRVLQGAQQYSGEQFPTTVAGPQTISTDQEPVSKVVENMEPLLANLYGIGSASVPLGAVGSTGSKMVQPAMGSLAEAAPPFYSAAQRAVGEAKLGKGTPEQWLGYLRNQPGVKAEEMDWLFGNLPKGGPLTKAQMEAHAAENAVTLGEVVKGNPKETALMTPDSPGFDPDRIQRANPTKYSQWQLPGGENYRETLLTLPSGMPDAAKAAIDKYNLLNRKMADQMAEWKGLAEANPPGHQDTLAAYARLVATRREAHVAEDAATKIKQQYRDSTFRSSHWDEPNVLAHIRMNDRNIPGVGKSLHAEELQSDLHQKGRTAGYQHPPREEPTGRWRVTQKNPDGTTVPYEFDTKAEAEAWAPRVREANREATVEPATRTIESPYGAVPDFPFKTTWADLSLKRLIREASEKGYDAVSWTPGEAQAARYDLSKHINDVTLHGSGSNMRLSAIDKNGRKVIDMQHVTDETLADHIGKEAAEKLLSQKTPDPNNPYAARHLLNADLKIGGEGMKAFYDKMLVDKANALGKKHGARVEQGHIPVESNEGVSGEMVMDWFNLGGNDRAAYWRNLSQQERDRLFAAYRKDGDTAPVHVLRITPELREAAMKGFPLFTAGGVVAGGAMSELAQQDRYGQNE